MNRAHTIALEGCLGLPPSYGSINDEITVLSQTTPRARGGGVADRSFGHPERTHKLALPP